MKTKIIVDSTADLMTNIKEQVAVVPLTVFFGEEEFVDGVTIDHKTFYEKLTTSEFHPTTSQATPAAFAAEFEKVQNGAVVITLASKLSGTYQSAVIAADDFEDIYVVESGNATVGAAILVERALQLADQGLTAKEIAEILEEEKNKIVLIALVDTLEYFKRGGRISATVAFAGAVLNIKPVISVIGGEISILGKARGTKLGNAMLMQEVEKTGGIDFSKPVMLGYTGLQPDLLLKFLEENDEYFKSNLEETRYTSIGSVIGTHAGPNAFAIAYFKK